MSGQDPDRSHAPEGSIRGTMAKRLLLASLLVGAGAVAGWAASGGPMPTTLPPEVHSGLLVTVGAIVAALLAMAGAYVGGSLAAEGARQAAMVAASTAVEEGRQARLEAREQAIRDEIRRLGALIVTAANRHVQDIATQIAAREEAVGKSADTPLPPLPPTTEVEDAINRMYTLGRRAQRAGDIAAAHFALLKELDRFAFDRRRDAVDDKIPALTPNEQFQHAVFAEAARTIKTDLMSAVAVASGGEALVPGGQLDQLPVTYLRERVAQAQERLLGAQAGARTISGSVETSS